MPGACLTSSRARAPSASRAGLGAAAAPALTGRAWRAHYRERALAERGMRHRVYRGFAWRLCDCELGCNAVLRTPKQAQSHVAAHK